MRKNLFIVRMLLSTYTIVKKMSIFIPGNRQTRVIISSILFLDIQILNWFIVPEWSWQGDFLVKIFTEKSARI